MLRALRSVYASGLIAGALALPGCGNSSLPAPAPASGGAGAGNAIVTPLKYDATITRTKFGVPHIRAGDFASLGYGYGYAFSEDNLCLLLDDLITIRGERSRYFGPTGPYSIFANGATATNVDSDFFWKLMATQEASDRIKNAAEPDARAAITGTVDGINRYIAELKAGQHAGRHASCRDAEHLLPVSTDDLYRRFYRLSVLASSSVFVQGVSQAAPPATGAAPTPAVARARRSPSVQQMVDAVRADPGEMDFFLNKDRPFGSNMYALGPDATEDGQSIQFVNPHFPWRGTERLYLFHATVPGKMDIMGSSLYGVPAVLIGFNSKLAWSHTVSAAYRFTFYELTLAPNDPTSYVYDGQVMAMEKVPLSIEVKNADGSISTRTRTLYRSKFGPMLIFNVSGANIFPWTTSKAYTLRDANAENDRLINQFFGWNKAASLTEFKALHQSILGVPWVNTTATGPGELAYYGDVTVVPNVPDSLVQTCSTSAQAQALAQLAPGLPLLDGSRADCEWLTDADAPAPGIFGPANLPVLERRDWVSNMNDSYWLTNPKQPLTGFARILGSVNTTRSLRTRHGIRKLQNREAGSDGFPGTQWTTERLQQSVLDSHIYSAEIALDKVLTDYCGQATAVGSAGPVNIAAECAALRVWDRSNNLDSRGGHIWREFWRAAIGSQQFYLTGYSAADPVNTPTNVNTQSPQVRQAFADAVKRYQDLGIAANTPLGDIQKSAVHNNVPLFGGIGNTEGAFTIASAPTPTSAEGYKVAFGNSHVAVVTWGANNAPLAKGFITYGQSTDPASPHFQDFTEAYSRKEWTLLPFTDAQVTAEQIGVPLRIFE
jgi:acyl-homoserine-lactone acylase